MYIALTRNVFCRLGQRRLCCIRTPQREGESYYRNELDNVECLFYGHCYECFIVIILSQVVMCINCVEVYVGNGSKHSSGV